MSGLPVRGGEAVEERRTAPFLRTVPGLSFFFIAPIVW